MDQFEKQIDRIRNGRGFFAALDQSGGSTPKALQLYGVGPDAYRNETEMFDQVHAMRSRIIRDKSFDGDRIIGAILFEGTMDRDIDGVSTPRYLWERKNIVPFVKVDKGLAATANGVQMMKPMPDLDALLKRAKSLGVAGTKMRSLIHKTDEKGISEVVDQQFEIGRRILAASLVPIIEPEVSIECPTKSDAEAILALRIQEQLDRLQPDQNVVLKLTLPDETNLYERFTKHDRVLRVVALSGGYSRDQANEKLAKNRGVIASFSRALAEDLNASQTDEAFSAALEKTIQGIYLASIT